MKDFNIDDYVKSQAEDIICRYEKHLADTGKHETMAHFLQNYYIPLNHAYRFHVAYFKKVSPVPPSKN